MFDLLPDDGNVMKQRPDITFQEDSKGNLTVKGLTKHKVTNEEEALNLLFEGESNRTISQHYHECGGKRYIDEDLDLYCDKCNNRAFLLDSRFKCESHDDFRPIDKMAFMSSLSLMSRTSNVPKNIIRKMMNALMDNEN